MQLANHVAVRTARQTDRDDVTAMWIDFLGEQNALDSRLVISDDALDRWRNDFSEWITAGVHGLFVADHDKEGLIGFASVHLWFPAPIYRPELEAYIDELFVEPDWRRRGIASALLEEIRNWAAEHQARRIRLGVLSANESGLAFWQSVGATSFVATLLIE